MKVIIVGSGGGGVACGRCWAGEMLGDESFLWFRKRVVRICWRLETRAKGVVFGRWRWASLIVGLGFEWLMVVEYLKLRDWRGI